MKKREKKNHSNKKTVDFQLIEYIKKLMTRLATSRCRLHVLET